MAKFLVTSDWHMGQRLGSAGEAAPRFREIRLETAKRIVDLAREEEASALFLLGDIFDGDGVGTDDLRATLGLLREGSCLVYVLPGNHDWWHRGGTMEAFARAAEKDESVRVLHELDVPLVVPGLEGVTFYPCPVHKKNDIKDPTRWIPERSPDDGVRVGLVHGGLDRADWGGRVPERVADVRDLDLVVLGDWHKPVEGPDGRTWYAGSPEPGGFDEAHEGQVLIVSVAGTTPQVTRRVVGRLAWRRIALELESETIGGVGIKELTDALAGLDTPKDTTAVRLRLAGRLTPGELDQLDLVLEELQGDGWATLDLTVGVEPVGEPDLDAIEEEAVRAVARRIWDSDADATVKRRALALLIEHVEAGR